MIKKFIIRSFLFIMLSTALMIGYYELIVGMDVFDSYQSDRFLFEQLKDQKEEIEAITVGHSNNRAIDFSALKMKGYHAWLGGQDIFESLYILKKIAPELPNLNTVFYPVSYHFRRDNGYNESKRIQLYSIFPNGGWIKGDFTNWLKAKHYYIKNISFSKQKKTLEEQGRGFEIARDGSRISKDLFRIIDSTEIYRIAKEQEPMHKGIVSESNHYNANLYNETNLALKEFADFLKERNIRVVFFTPPYHHFYSELFEDSVQYEITGYMEKFALENEVEYYNFSEADSIIFRDDFFYDDDHLNLSKGAPYFSSILKKKLGI